MADFESILIGFDDGRGDNYDNAYPLLVEYGCKATIYLVSDLLNTTGYITTAEAQEMYASGLVDIGNHTKSHPRLALDLSLEQIEAQLLGCKAALDALGLTRASNHVAYPRGSHNELVLDAMVSTGMNTGRTILGGEMGIDYVYTMTPTYPAYSALHQLRHRYVKSFVSLEDAKAFVDAAVTNGGSIYLTFHSIKDVIGDDYDWLTDDFESLLAYITGLGLTTETVAEWYARYSQKYLPPKRILLKKSEQP